MALTKITSNVIATNAISGTLIADNAITAVHIAQNAITQTQIAAGALSDALAANSITAAMIPNDLIDSDHFADGGIDSAHLAADVVTGAKIADDAIDSEHYTDASIDLAHMSVNSIDSDQYVDGSIDTAHLAADVVTGAKIADDAIDSEHYTDGSIDTAHLAADVITSAKIADDAVTSDHMAAGSIYAASIVDDNVTLAKMAGITRGSIIIGNASGNPAALAIGTNDYVLTSDGTDLAWEAASGAVTALNNATANEVVTVGSTTTELDAESTMTFDGETLYVVGNNDPRDVLHLNNSANANSDLVFRNNSNSWNIKGDQAVTLQSGASGAGADYLAFYTNGGSNERMRIAENGWVTIGTSARINQNAITSSSAAVAWDAQAAANAYHLTTENTTFSAPSNATEGQIISVEIAQGGTARTIAWNTVFEFAASTAPTITATASKTDILTFRYNGSVWQEIGRVQNMAQT